MPSLWSWGFPALGNARALQVLQVINAGAIIGCYQFAGAAPHPLDLSGLVENIWKLSFPKQKCCWGSLLLGLWIRAVLAAPPFSLFSVSFSLPISPSPRWTGFKKENSKPCLKAICGRRWAQLWSADFSLLENLRCAGGFYMCLSIYIYICVCIKASLCCRSGGGEGIWGVSAWSVMWFFPTFSTVKAEALHKWWWKMLQ